MKLYKLQSQPQDGRYSSNNIGAPKLLHNEGNFAPIYAQDSFKRFPKGRFLRNAQGEHVVEWIGGRYPSGHIEIYSPVPSRAWRDETLPIKLEDADALIAKRTARVSRTDGKANFLYRITEVK